MVASSISSLKAELQRALQDSEEALQITDPQKRRSVSLKNIDSLEMVMFIEESLTNTSQDEDLIGAYLSCCWLQIVLESHVLSISILDEFLARIHSLRLSNCIDTSRDLNSLYKKIIDYFYDEKDYNLILAYLERVSDSLFPSCPAKDNLIMFLNIQLCEIALNHAIMNFNDSDRLQEGLVILNQLKQFDAFKPEVLDMIMSILDKSDPEQNSELETLQTSYSTIMGKYLDNKTSEISERAELILDTEAQYTMDNLELNMSYYFGNIKSSSEKVFVKEYTVYSEEKFVELKRYSEHLGKISSMRPVFMKYYGSYQETALGVFKLGIVMKHYRRTLTEDILRRQKRNRNYSEKRLRKLFIELIETLDYLHGNKVSHLDLNTDNLFVLKRQIIIGDFNRSKEIDYTDSNPSLRENSFGTHDYYPPEVRAAIESNCQSKYRPQKADVYSLGMIFLQMVFLRFFKDFNLTSNLHRLQMQIEQIELDCIKQLIKSMTAFKPSERPSPKRLLKIIS